MSVQNGPADSLILTCAMAMTAAHSLGVRNPGISSRLKGWLPWVAARLLGATLTLRTGDGKLRTVLLPWCAAAGGPTAK